MDLSAVELEQTSLRALHRYARQCRDTDHRDCDPPGICEQAWEAAAQKIDFDAAARQYDIGAQRRPPAVEQPAHTWSTVALFRVVVRQLFNERPWAQMAFRRTVWLTSALAKLGERGIPPDAVIRTYFGTRICRAMTLEIVSAKMALLDGRVTIDQLPPQVRDWLPHLPARQTFDELAIESLTGPFAEDMQQWIRHAALAHLLDWRHDAQLVDIAPEDCAVPAGAEATRWLVDRFTRTALDDWFRSSLDWELAYRSDPLGTSRAVGVSPNVIAERPISEAMVINAIGRRIREPSSHDEVFAGMSRVEVMDNIIGLSLRHERQAALALTRKALQVRPTDSDFGQAMAFLLIPVNTVVARHRLLELRVSRGDSDPLINACLAICALREGGHADAVDGLKALAALDEAFSCWLWTPETLTSPEPELGEFSISEWASEVLSQTH